MSVSTNDFNKFPEQILMLSQKDELLKWREEFPILNNTTYLISNSLGAMPKSVYNKMQEYAETWATRGVRAWEEYWWELNAEVGNIIVPLIGAGPNEISMHMNISLLQSIILSCFDFNSKKNEIVYSSLEFPSEMYVFEKFATKLGAKVKLIESENLVVPSTEKILDAIDERTLLVPVSHVLFRSAYIMDINAIVEKAHSVGAYVILDTYHSTGTMPVDVKKLGVDILIGGVLKWLCGGPGGIFLWIEPSLRSKLEPTITGWLAHMEPFAFEKKMEYTQEVYKFLNGTPSIPALYSSQEGPKIINKIGIDKIRKKSIHQTSLVTELAQKEGYKINSPMDATKRGGTVTIDMPDSYLISKELLKRNIIVDYRKDAGIRIAPHFYNSDDEILFAMHELKKIIQNKSYLN
jgi:kynureninase